jgi:hypothetical protein
MELAQHKNGSARIGCFLVKAGKRDLLRFAVNPFFYEKINIKQ